MLPFITFVEGMGPLITMYARHNSGCNQYYLRLPRQPHNTLGSEKGNKLCHAVIKTRTVKPTKTNKYSNTFQIHEQRVLFQGIDTCNITSVGNIAYCSVLLDKPESRTIVVDTIFIA